LLTPRKQRIFSWIVGFFLLIALIFSSFLVYQAVKPNPNQLTNNPKLAELEQRIQQIKERLVLNDQQLEKHLKEQEGKDQQYQEQKNYGEITVNLANNLIKLRE
jgi:hypothetical protein